MGVLWTTKELKFLREHAGTMSVRDLSKRLGRSDGSIRSFARTNDVCLKCENQYVLYKDEKIIAAGTIKEIAEKMNVKQQTIRFYHTPSAAGRTKRGRVLVKSD